MTPEQFVYWLQGFAELSGEEPPTVEQWEVIKVHLDHVFEKKTIHKPGLSTTQGTFTHSILDRPPLTC